MAFSSGDGYSSAAGGDQPTMSPAVLAIIVGSASLVMFLSGPFLVRAIAWILGWILRLRTSGRRAHIVALMDEDEVKLPKETPHSDLGAKDAQQDWDGIVGFFHLFCNAGGGGERVLWAAIRATQNRWPRAKCVVYTGDHDVNKDAILQRVQSRFNIHLHPPAVTFLYLSMRNWVLASTWPRFTLLGQSLGSMVLAWDALSLLVPDIFVDTMGYAFALGLCEFLFRNIPTAAYVHYPTISTDMLDSLDPTSTVGSQGVNAGQGKGARGQAKKAYWRLFARLYCWAGSSIDVVMTNSTWTQGHIQALWGPRRSHKGGAASFISVVYLPVAVREFIQKTDLSEASEKKREKVLLYIAQFRPEKNHTLILQSFADFLKTKSNASDNARLTLIGSVRDDQDSKMIYQLRLLANELGIKDRVEFHLDVPWPQILEWLGKASVGVNGMWNEHFGIGVVEYQAAGLISVVHNSGGPKLDIVISIEGEATGFYATTAQEFAAAFEKALSLDNPLAARKRARASAMRFTEEEFSKNWQTQLGQLVAMRK